MLVAPGPNNPGRGGGPMYPPVQKPTPPPLPNYAEAVLAMVDDPAKPTVATVYIGDDLPAEDGYKIPQNLGVTIVQAPNAWSNSKNYTPGQYVADNGVYYKCVTANFNSEPPNANWTIPSGVAYYNNPATMMGGSWVMVDTTNRVIISIQQGFSTSPPANPSDLFQFIRHDGAYNTTGNFQNPQPIDNSQLTGNPSPNTPPAFATGGSPTPLIYIGSFNAQGQLTGGTYDAETTFTLTQGAPSWLGEIALIAVPQ